ncbi:MAG: thiamine-phosphate kinase [Myxococcales bacterium]|nr:thiamine-phosphate kinase [Myxococcales bacterium]
MKWSSGKNTVGEVGEDQLLSLISTHAQTHSELAIPIGDDAACLTVGDSSLVVTVDAQLEGQHFHREWLSPRQLGYRAFRVSASDVSAMGCLPKWALMSLQIPPDLNVQSFEEIMAGFQQACADASTVLVGGNLAKTNQIGLHITVIGQSTSSPLSRADASDGDYLWVTGSLGSAAAGRLLLELPKLPDNSLPLIEKWQCPPARWDLCGRLCSEGIATAAMDISDGLYTDASRMARASSLSIEIDLDHLPIHPLTPRAADYLKTTLYELVVRGGEDYEVLFAGPETLPDWAMATGVRRIGRFKPGDGLVTLKYRGSEFRSGDIPTGWDPFEGTP